MNDLTHWQIFSRFARIGFTSLGASATEIMRQHLVDEKQWLTTDEFRENLSLAAIIPGPFHVNLACFSGYRILGFTGCIAAVVGYVIPGFVILALIIASVGSERVSQLVQKNPAFINGVTAGICGLLMHSILRLSDRTLEMRSDWLLILILALLMQTMQIPFLLLALLAGLYFLGRSLYFRSRLR